LLHEYQQVALHAQSLWHPQPAPDDIDLLAERLAEELG
jgi:hypothetical protein